MENKELFERSFNVLLNAYKTDTLIYSSQCACAVGNLVAAANNYKIVQNINSFYGYHWESEDNNDLLPQWGECMNMFGTNSFNKERYRGRCKSEVESTGYNVQTIIEIENIFCLTAFSKIYKSEKRKKYECLFTIIKYLLNVHKASKKEENGFVTLLKNHRPK